MNKRIVLLGSLASCFIALAGILFFEQVSSQTASDLTASINYLKQQAPTPWVTMALAGAGETASDMDYLKLVSSGQESAFTYAKYVLALASWGKNPTNFGSQDYVAKLKSYFVNNQFGDETLLNDDFWAVLALGACGQEYSPQAQKAKDFILAHQNNDGGWGYQVGAESDTNDTAAAVIALLETGVAKDSSVLQKAQAYLKSSQNDDGGFGYTASAASDSCSDGWVISALYKLGQDPASSSWLKNSKSPLTSLQSFRDTDGGFWWQKPGDNKICTSYAVLALAGKTFPVASAFNEHYLRIEGKEAKICQTKANSVTALGLVSKAVANCGYQFTINDYPGLGLYLAKINQETDWMYMVNYLLPMVGGDSYYLALGDEVLWYAGEWLDKGWQATKLVMQTADNQLQLQAQYFNSTTSSWQNFQQPIKLLVSGQEMDTDSFGKLSLGLAVFSSGIHPLQVKRQVIDGIGYLASEAVTYKSGEAPSSHQASLKVEIEGIQPLADLNQESISFSLSPDNFNFGKLKPGATAAIKLNLQNGTADIVLQAEVSGDNVFKDNLKISEQIWSAFSLAVAANQTKQVNLKLLVPSSYSGAAGVKEGELTFWATKK
jgi:hypothetical protein